MHRNHFSALLALLAAAAACASTAAADDGGGRAGLQLARDASGVLGTVNLNGRMRTDGPFFQSLGTNGRSCASCHVAEEAFSFTPAGARARFKQSTGRDPIFTPVDGANCPTLKQEDRAAHSLLLQNGLIRVGITMPAKPEFTISVVHDPYGCAIIPDSNGGLPTVSVYRRPLPATNLMFLSTVMFDGRETHQPLTGGQTFYDNLVADLSQQAIDATTGHAQANKPPSATQVQGIVEFELGLVTAQLRDDQAGELATPRALGGPFALANQDYYPGINDSLGGDPTGQAFDMAAMNLFAGWADAGRGDGPGASARAEARRAIAAGEALFDTAPLQISNVRGLNDNAALGSPPSFVGHCTSCHDTPNVGNHSMPLPLDIGTAHSTLPSMESDASIAAALHELSMPDLPVYLINGCPNPFASGQPESFYTTDPGKALISGSCSDFNRIKGPVLRGLAARAPYFHNGAAADLHEVVNFYNVRFSMHLSEQQKSDLTAFLNSL